MIFFSLSIIIIAIILLVYLWSSLTPNPSRELLRRQDIISVIVFILIIIFIISMGFID